MEIIKTLKIKQSTAFKAKWSVVQGYIVPLTFFARLLFTFVTNFREWKLITSFASHLGVRVLTFSWKLTEGTRTFCIFLFVKLLTAVGIFTSNFLYFLICGIDLGLEGSPWFFSIRFPDIRHRSEGFLMTIITQLWLLVEKIILLTWFTLFLFFELTFLLFFFITIQAKFGFFINHIVISALSTSCLLLCASLGHLIAMRTQLRLRI